MDRGDRVALNPASSRGSTQLPPPSGAPLGGNDVAFDVSPGGRWFALSTAEQVAVYERDRFLRAITFEDPPALVWSLAFVDDTPSLAPARMFLAPARAFPSILESNHVLVTVDRAGKVTPFAVPLDLDDTPVKAGDGSVFSATVVSASRSTVQPPSGNSLGVVPPESSVARVDDPLSLIYLETSRGRFMAAIKISSTVEESVWRELRAIAEESHQSIGGLLTEAIREYVRRRRVRPEVLRHLDESISDNEELGRLLAS